MCDGIETALRERYKARTGFPWRNVRDSSFKEWQLLASNASWNNLIWTWEELGITEIAREMAKRLKFVPSEIFAHPDVLADSPELLNYYRLLACVPNKVLTQFSSDSTKRDQTELCKLLNRMLSSQVGTPAKASRESLFNPNFAETVTEWQRTWVDSIGRCGANDLEQILGNFAVEKNLLDTIATAKLIERTRGLVLKSGTVLRFGCEPDVECRNASKELICVIEIKGSADKAGAQTRLGETKKSFTKAKLENPRCHTIFLPSVLTTAVRNQLKTEREIDQVFNLPDILKDERKRAEFLNEFFKFRLREGI